MNRAIVWTDSFGEVTTEKGHTSFVVQYRDLAGKSRRYTLKAGLTRAQARREAKLILADVARGGDPLKTKREARKAVGTTFQAVAEDYLKREAGKLRTGNQRRDILRRLIYPTLGKRQIADIKRSEIVRLLDRVEDENGAHMAQAVLTVLSRLFNWHASRDDGFSSPVRRGMARTSVKEHARERVLSDDELRAVWEAAGAFPGPYGPLVRFLLLTATRRGEAAGLTRGELADNDWIIPAARMKNKQEFVLPLSRATRAIIDGMPNLGAYIFSYNGRGPICGFTIIKRRFDEACGVTSWRVHDLRRTARSLMSRAGVAPDVAERCLAHAIGGVRGTYDRHAYHDEKARAFEALASLIERIVEPAANVVAIRR